MFYHTDALFILAKKLEKKHNQFIYHLKSDNFKGKYIYPLSELEETHSELYKQEIKKYKGRERDPEIKIDLLDAKWKDCVNFSTIDPVKIFQLEELLGIPARGSEGGLVEIFKFNIKDLEGLNFCLYDDNKGPRKKEAYKKVSVETYKEEEFLPPETVKYFAECKEKKEYPLLFGGVTHLLVTDKIPIDKAEIIKFEGAKIKL